jgi:hypothetical protein
MMVAQYADFRARGHSCAGVVLVHMIWERGAVGSNPATHPRGGMALGDKVQIVLEIEADLLDSD